MKRLLESHYLALAAGLLLRLFLVFEFPSNSGDTVLYEELATNWLKHGAYALRVDGHLTPVDMRMPGYPAFLALIYAVSGRTGEAARLWVMLAQVAVDLLTCVLIAALAYVISNGTLERRRRIAHLALWLAATCPFIANYVAIPLTEIFATFFTAAALLLLALLVRFVAEGDFAAGSDLHFIRGVSAFLGVGAGFLTGLGALFRPETPLLLLAAWIVFGGVLLRRGEARRWIRLVIVTGLVSLAPLAPWTIRNAVTLHELQPLTPPYSQLPGELVPRGFMNWERTWLYRFRDVYLVSWKLDSELIDINDIPAYAYDSSAEKQRVAALLDEYNSTLTLSEAEDAAFGQIARERTARHPLRTYVKVPLARAVTMWFTPRIELLPYSGKVFPLSQAWEGDPVDLSVTVGFFLLNALYVVLAFWGGRRVWHIQPHLGPVIAFLAGFVALRTAFLTTLETPEPRYMVVCFPVVLAFAAQVWPGPASRS